MTFELPVWNANTMWCRVVCVSARLGGTVGKHAFVERHIMLRCTLSPQVMGCFSLKFDALRQLQSLPRRRARFHAKGQQVCSVAGNALC